jgi:hypothetical protein
MLVLAMGVDAGENIPRAGLFSAIPPISRGASEDDFARHWRIWWDRLMVRAVDPMWRLELPISEDGKVDEAQDIRDVRAAAQEMFEWLTEWYSHEKPEIDRIRPLGVECQRVAHEVVDLHIRGLLGPLPSKDVHLTITVVPVQGSQCETHGNLLMVTPEFLNDEAEFRHAVREVLLRNDQPGSQV